MLYKYTLKVGFEDMSWTTIERNEPFVVGVSYIHLFDGIRYSADAIYRAKPNEKAYPDMPNTVVHMRKL